MKSLLREGIKFFLEAVLVAGITVSIFNIFSYRNPPAYIPFLTATATLDFGNTAAGTSTDLTITVTGAADGQPVIIGVPNGSTSANGVYTAWVVSANTVNVRFTNTNLLTAINPASGTFRASVLPY